MKLDVKYYAVHDLEKVIATTQRTASVSMIESMAPAHEGSRVEKISAEDVFTFRNWPSDKGGNWPVLLWMRHPFERLASAYSIFGRYCSLEEFIQRALKETNPHWSPVTKLHTIGKYFLPTHVFPFTSLAETWAEQMPGYKLEHLDKTPNRISWNEGIEFVHPKTLMNMDNHWHDDLALYRWALEAGVHKVAA